MTDMTAFLDAYRNAIFQKDIEGFLALFDEDVRIFDMWEDWAVDGLAAWRGRVEAWFSGLGADRDKVEFDAIEILGAGELIAVSAFVRFAAVTEQGEELRHLWNRMTLLIQEKAGVWKIVHQHSSAPVGGEGLKAKLER